MILIAASTCCCTIVVHIFFRGQGQVPPLLRKIFLEILAKVFCMVTLPPPQPQAEKKTQGQPANLITSVNSQGNQMNGKKMIKYLIIVNSLMKNKNNSFSITIKANLIHQVSRQSVINQCSSQYINVNNANNMQQGQNQEGFSQIMPSNVQYPLNASLTLPHLPSINFKIFFLILYNLLILIWFQKLNLYRKYICE